MVGVDYEWWVGLTSDGCGLWLVGVAYVSGRGLCKWVGLMTELMHISTYTYILSVLIYRCQLTGLTHVVGHTHVHNQTPGEREGLVLEWLLCVYLS